MNELTTTKKIDKQVIISLGRYKGKYNHRSETNGKPCNENKQRIINTVK